MELEFTKEYIEGYMELSDEDAEYIEKVIKWIKAGNLKEKKITNFADACSMYDKAIGKNEKQ
jgi:hypothetical protein